MDAEEARAQQCAGALLASLAFADDDDSVTEYLTGVLYGAMPLSDPEPDAVAMDDLVEVVGALVGEDTPSLGDRVRDMVDAWRHPVAPPVDEPEASAEASPGGSGGGGGGSPYGGGRRSPDADADADARATPHTRPMGPLASPPGGSSSPSLAAAASAPEPAAAATVAATAAIATATATPTASAKPGRRRRRGKQQQQQQESTAAAALSSSTPASSFHKGKGVDAGLRHVLVRYCGHDRSAVDATMVEYLQGMLSDAAEERDPAASFRASLESFLSDVCAADTPSLDRDVALLVAEQRRERQEAAKQAAPRAPPLPIKMPLDVVVGGAGAGAGAGSMASSVCSGTSRAGDASTVAFPSRGHAASERALEEAQAYDPSPYNHHSAEVNQLVALGITVRRDIIARVLWRKCHGDLGAAATMLFEPGVEEQELKDIEAEIARRAADVQRVKDDEKAKLAARKKILQRFDEQEDKVGAVHRPHVPGGVGLRGSKTKKKKVNQVRFFNNQIVARNGEKTFFVDKEPKPASQVKAVGNYPTGSGGSIKVITKGKRGPGFRMA